MSNILDKGNSVDSSRIQLFTETNVTVALMKLGLPMVASMLVTAIYNFVDTYFVASLGTEQAAAVAVAFPLSLAFSGVGLTFGVGAASYLSRLLGMREYEEARKVSSVAAMGFTLRVIALGVSIVVGYMKGFQPLVGFNYGAKNVARVRDAIRSCLAWTTGFCVVFSIAAFALAPQIMGLFSADPEVLAISVEGLRINSLLFFTLGFQYTFATLYIALGKALAGGLLTVCRQGVMFIPAVLALPLFFGLEGVMWSQNVADILSTVTTAIFAIWILKKPKEGRSCQL